MIMKKSLITILLIFLLLFMAGCGASQEPVVPDQEPTEDADDVVPGDEDPEETEISGAVYFSQLKYDPETGSLMYTIANDTNEAVIFGGEIVLKKKTIDGLWTEMQPLRRNGEEGIRFLVTKIVQISAGENGEGSVDLENTFGKLMEGEYRIFIQIGTSHGSETILGGFRVAPVM